MPREKRLCLVIPTLQPGGMERVMSQLADYFSRKTDLEVHLILYGRNPDLFYKVSDNVILHIPKQLFNNHFRFFSTLRRLLFIRQTIIKIRADSILSFGERWNSFVLLAVLWLKIPVYISDRSSPEKKLGFFHDNLRNILYRNAQGLIVQTQKAKNIYQKIFRHSRIEVIGNPIKEINVSEDLIKKNIILTVGRLIPSKNHSKLIDSFLKLNKSNWKLIIVGGNALKLNLINELKNKIKLLEAEDRILLTGTIDNVDKYYLTSKIFVFTSESEGFPNVIGEAMAASLPVVSFDCIAGPSEMIENDVNGFLVELHNYKMLEKKLLLLIDNPKLREQIGCMAKESIKRFSLERIGDAYLSFINNSK